MQFLIPEQNARMMGVYIIRNSIDARVYVGSAKNFLNRKKSHLKHFAKQISNQKFQNFVNKHGVNTLRMELLEIVTEPSSLAYREQHYLDFYDSVKKGFNVCPIAMSCVGMKMPEGFGEVVRERMMGKRYTLGMAPWNKGKSLPDSFRRKCSENNRGTRNPNYGKPMPDREKKILRDICIKPVLQYSKEGVLLAEFDSLASASRATGISVPLIWLNLQKKTKICKKLYKWEYNNKSLKKYFPKSGG